MADVPPARPVHRWIPAIAVTSSAVMEVIDTSVVNVSLPHLAGTLSATTDEAGDDRRRAAAAVAGVLLDSGRT